MTEPQGLLEAAKRVVDSVHGVQYGTSTPRQPVTAESPVHWQVSGAAIDALRAALLASPAPDPGAGLREAFAAMTGTLFWAHGDGCPLKYNANLPDPCSCGTDAALDALNAALSPSAEPPETAE